MHTPRPDQRRKERIRTPALVALVGALALWPMAVGDHVAPVQGIPDPVTGPVTVTVRDYEFDPPVLVVKAGTTVNWHWEGPTPEDPDPMIHEVECWIKVWVKEPGMEPGQNERLYTCTGDPVGMSKPYLGQTRSDGSVVTDWSYTFNRVGNYNYHCNIAQDHTAQMHGFIRVVS